MIISTGDSEDKIKEKALLQEKTGKTNPFDTQAMVWLNKMIESGTSEQSIHALTGYGPEFADQSLGAHAGYTVNPFGRLCYFLNNGMLTPK